MGKPKTMGEVVKALQTDNIDVRDISGIKMGNEPAACFLCRREVDRPLMFFPHNAVYWTAVCPDRPACRRRQAEAEDERIRTVLEEVVV